MVVRLEAPSRGGSRITRNTVALWPLTAVLLYWLGDFNTYAYISSREYVVGSPASGRRVVYSAGLGLACAIAAGAAIRGVGRNWPARFVALVVVFTAVLYLAADLNMYVVGLGPDGQDWVKNRSEWGAERLLECVVLAGVASSLGCLVLRVVAAARGPQLGKREPAEPGAAADGAV